MPYQSDEQLFLKRLANAGLLEMEFKTLYAMQNERCAYCHKPTNPYDLIIDNSHNCIKLICYDCDVCQTLDRCNVNI